MFFKRPCQHLLLFALLAFSKQGFCQTPRPVPSTYSSTVPVSYVRTWDVVAPESNSGNLHVATTIDKARLTTQYVDGLGRPLQTVVKQGSLKTGGTAADLVSAVEYDEFGREQFKYLPFVANTAGSNTSISDGLFKLNPFVQQAEFYSNTSTSPIKGQGETFFYGQTQFEASPLNRPLKVMAAGNSWMGAEKGIEQKYWINTATDAVRIWNITNSTILGDFGTYSTTATYPAGELYKNATVDEAGHQVLEFKDKEGKVILKKVQLTATADDGTGSAHTGWLCTYYIYDDLGQLRCVIQPEGVKTLADPAKADWDLSYSSGVLLQEQCFRYEYDGRGRMIVKKVPGAAPVYMIYDARDRLVMTQDGNQRDASKKQWLYTQYDHLNRPIATGILTDPSNYNNLSYHLSAASTSTAYPNLGSYSSEELTRTFYDDYSWRSAQGNPLSETYNSGYDTYFQPASTTTFPYPKSNVPSTSLTGLVTGSKVKVLGTSTYLYTVNIYDDKARLIQVQSTNATGGSDIATTQYSWAGLPLVSIQKTQKAGTNTQTTVVVTQISYDELGRVVKTEKKLSNTLVNSGSMPASFTTTAQLEYDALGQLKTKKLAPTYNSNTGLETLSYDYNIRGWTLGMNRDYARDANSSSHFGFDLGYDKTANGLIGSQSYSAAQYNGNISGMVWKSAGDGEKRKYDFTYDALNRLTAADFNQYTSSAFNKTAGIDFSVSNLSYDGNGNLLSMEQKGWKLNGSSLIDQLHYTYVPNSNKLLSVTDFANEATSKLGDFKTVDQHPQSSAKAALSSTSTQGQFDAITDYSYDVNGNLTLDNNKSISSISYNHLNLPLVISVTGKGTITYTYDAAGNKLKKVTLDNTVTPAKTTITEYLAGMVYENDELQFVGQEEGRIRFTALQGSTPARFSYDYFIKDHLGNVRMVLTEEQKTNAYPAASMETAQSTIENTLYSNINTTRYSKALISGYPSDTYTNPNDYVAKTNGSGNKIGPAIVVKVMAGDQFNFRVTSWYKKNGTTPGTPVSPLTDLITALTSGIGGVVGSHATATELSNASVLNPGALSYYTSHNSSDSTTKPKAFVNWVLFDEQFKYVSTSSGFEQVGADNTLTIHQQSDLPITKNGYLYLYVSNETPNIDVFFDNLQVTHIRGPLLEETHYYPFGLTMAGISSEALNFGQPENKKKYNGIEKEDDLELNIYDAQFRELDPQTARWWQIDPVTNGYENISPYASMYDNPIKYSDPLGDEGESCCFGIPIPIPIPIVPFIVKRIPVVALLLDVNARLSSSDPSKNGVLRRLIELKTEDAKDLESKVKSLEKSAKSLEKNVKEHEQKLKDYAADPDKYDNKGELQGVSPELRKQKIDGRIKALEKQIKKNQGELDKANKQLEQAKKDLQNKNQEIKKLQGGGS